VGHFSTGLDNWGKAKARKFLWLNQIDELKPIGKLTERQRRLFAPQLARIPN
jgi:hypothetical protein